MAFSLHVGVKECRWTDCKGQHFRRPVLRITWQPYSIKAYAQMNVLSKWVNNQPERGGVGGQDVQLQQILLSPVCSHQLLAPSSHCLYALGLLSVIKTQVLLLFCISFVLFCSCNPTLFLNGPKRLSSTCFDRVVHSTFKDNEMFKLKEPVKTGIEVFWRSTTTSSQLHGTDMDEPTNAGLKIQIQTIIG